MSDYPEYPDYPDYTEVEFTQWSELPDQCTGGDGCPECTKRW